MNMAYTGDETFAEAIDRGNLHALLGELIEETNAACRRHPNSGRDAGVYNPRSILADPLRLDRVELTGQHEGYVLLSGGGVVEVAAPFKADNNVCEWSQTDMLDHIPNGE